MRKSKTRSKVRRWIEYSLLLIGLAGVGLWSASNAIPAIWQDWENWVFDHDVQGQSTSFSEYVTARTDQIARDLEQKFGLHVTPERSTAGSAGSAASVPPQPRTTIGKNSLIGRLAIPRLHLRAMVREGDSNDTLSLTAGHIPGTAFPWQGGNFSVAGHRDTLFRGMGDLRKNDLIQFDTLDTSYVYEVASTQIVEPEDVRVLKPGAYPELTLVTCYPFNYIGSAPERFIVKARELYRVSSRQQSGLEDPAPPPAQTIKSKPKPEQVTFTIATNHSRQLAPGISLGVMSTDIGSQQMSGWMWLMPDRRTIWLRDHGTQDPLVFYLYADGKRRELFITRVTANSVTGYLML
jgi:sortase A